MARTTTTPIVSHCFGGFCYPPEMGQIAEGVEPTRLFPAVRTDGGFDECEKKLMVSI